VKEYIYAPPNIKSRMLFIMIPIAWLGVAALVLAVCKMAARGDAMPSGRSDTGVPARPTTLGAQKRAERSAVGS
jgi:hypothetical protein